MHIYIFKYTYIHVKKKKNILGRKFSRHFTNNQKMSFFPASEIYVYIYIYTRFRPPYPLNTVRSLSFLSTVM